MIKHENEGTIINLCQAGALDSLAEIVNKTFGRDALGEDTRGLIVTDETVWKAVSSRFSAFLREKPDTVFHILPGSPAPYASDGLVAEIAAALKANEGFVPIAVGSGTINDVVKRASFEQGTRYVCVPTAPSVDGFTSCGAAITVRGFKLTLECPAPLCVVSDEDILREAPLPLISAGFADLLAKLPGGADWILADELGIEPIDPGTWEIVQPVARRLLGNGAAVRARDSDAIAGLYQGLIASGLAMQRYKDSRPASGAEHLLAHTWEMSHLAKDGKPISHGFKVALGSLISTALAEELFGEEGSLRRLLEGRSFAPKASLSLARARRAETLLSGSPYLDQTLAMIAKKTPEPRVTTERAALAHKAWPVLARRYAAQIPPFAALKADLAAGGCPTEPADIGLSRAACVDSLKIASLIRNRYTVLDLVSELGILDEAAEAVFAEPWFSAYES
ncbi:MAG TPA: sn-glycerol-1-phosphate dehydrogenase [Rectinemataceae bacterium]|nr:sn-glycerol-1-phosphate dehydrogenase [Rectinemataceae bacterium]